MVAARVGVVIPAAGRARRFGSGENKIWVELNGQTVLSRTVSAFNQHSMIDTIIVVAGAHELERVQRETEKFQRVAAVVAGGDTRSESVRRGMEALPPEIEYVLVHDAARPLVSSELIDRVIDAAVLHGAAVPGLPLSDTVKRIGSGGNVVATVPRNAEVAGETINGLTSVQTPQGSRLSLLRDAYDAFKGPGEPTDEASLIECYGATVAVARGDAANIKITNREDVLLAERLLALNEREEVRTGFGYDVHAFASPEASRPLFLGGVEILHDRGLDGHSDADVVLHAICDALLGAACLGDIGILFPNTDSAYKNVNSLRLVEAVHNRLIQDGWHIVNIDATVLAEAPKLMPHRAAMSAAIGNSLQFDPARISIKATTSEGMGFVGRREGIACWAVATLKRSGDFN